MSRKFIITEEEKNKILSLYEQSEVQAAKIDDIATRLLPSNFVKEINESRGLEQRSDQIVDGKVRSKDAAPLRIHELVPISF